MIWRTKGETITNDSILLYDEGLVWLQWAALLGLALCSPSLYGFHLIGVVTFVMNSDDFYPICPIKRVLIFLLTHETQSHSIFPGAPMHAA